MFILLILLLLIPNIASAEYLGCFEPNETVYATVQFNGSTGAVTATSVSAKAYDPDDTSTSAVTISPINEVTGATGLFRGSFSVGATPLAGTWTTRYIGTVDGNVQAGSDTFHVVDTAGDCASRIGVFLAADQSAVTIGTTTAVTNGVTLANDAITAAKIAAGAIGASELAEYSGAVTADAGNTALTFRVNLTQTANDYWKDAFLTITSGALIGQTKAITAFTGWNGTYSVITVKGGFTGIPAGSVTFMLVNK